MNEISLDQQLFISYHRQKHDVNTKVEPPITVSVYPPTIFFDRLFKMIWSAFSIYEVAQSSINIDDYLPVHLHPVAFPTLYDHIKHKTLCAKPIIWIVRRSQVKAHPIWLSHDKNQLIDEILSNQKHNFVLLGDGRLVFAKIPRGKHKFPYRLLSKHIALANRFSDVRFAGEMRKSDNSKILLINNNSGTYKPSDDKTIQAIAHFQQIFPGLVIRRISRQ